MLLSKDYYIAEESQPPPYDMLSFQCFVLFISQVNFFLFFCLEIFGFVIQFTWKLILPLRNRERFEITDNALIIIIFFDNLIVKMREGDLKFKDLNWKH